ncbi:hypothetical protein ACXR2U_14720 [Jatrophihabitans sp. YIM 134969]
MTAPAPNTEAAAPRVRVPVGRILAVAVRPGFVVGHLVVVVLAVTTIWLGRWQWHAAHVHHGSVQNYAYAFQWWIFCAFGIAMWIRIMRDRAVRDLEPQAVESSDSGPAAAPAAETLGAGAPTGYRPYVMPTSGQIDADDPDDVMRARYNAALAERHSGGR